MRLQIVYTKAPESLRPFQKKALNSIQGKGATFLMFGVDSNDCINQSDPYTFPGPFQ